MASNAPQGGLREREEAQAPATVLIDALACKPGQSGILSHGVGVAEGLAAAPDFNVAILTTTPDSFARVKGATLVLAPSRVRSFVVRAAWREAFLPRLLRDLDAAAVLSTVPELPQRRLRVPSVMVVHDVAAAVAPGLYPPSRRFRYELLLRRALRNATQVVCVSHATLLDLHRWSGVSPSKCTVIGNAPQPMPSSGGHALTDDPYVLLVGNVYDNKNTRTVLEALSLARGALARGVRPTRLVMVGPLGPASAARLQADIRSTGVEDLVRHLGFVSPKTLGRLYAGATAVLYPSLYEGQGIPVMEAALLGTRIICSDLPSIREFMGADDVHWINRPLDPNEWAEAIVRLQVNQGGEATGGARRFPTTWQEIGASYAALLASVLRPS